MHEDKRSPAPRANAKEPDNDRSQLQQHSIAKQEPEAESDTVRLAWDALAEAARLIALNALLAEGAALRSEWPAFNQHMRIASAGLAEAREIAAMVIGGQQ